MYTSFFNQTINQCLKTSAENFLLNPAILEKGTSPLNYVDLWQFVNVVAI